MLIAVTFINSACQNRFIVSVLINIGNCYLLTHYFAQIKILIEVDHLQGVTNPYIQIKGTNKEIVSSAASALSLDGSYTTKVLKSVASPFRSYMDILFVTLCTIFMVLLVLYRAIFKLFWRAYQRTTMFLLVFITSRLLGYRN